MDRSKKLIVGAALAMAAGLTGASPFTTTSPTGGALPAGVTEIGGIVLDLTGLNGARVVSQLAASSLFLGTPSTTPLIIGTQAGFSSSITDALGGGLRGASVRITLFDGDTGIGFLNFDTNENFLRLNNINFGADNGDFTSVVTQSTDGSGAEAAGGSGVGFRNQILDTGFFSSVDPTLLADLFASIDATDQVQFSLFDVDPNDNFFDFTQGIDGGLINIGQGPVVSPPPGGSVPEPASLGLIGVALAAFVALRRRRQA